jgi:hypothetical protein
MDANYKSKIHFKKAFSVLMDFVKFSLKVSQKK